MNVSRPSLPRGMRDFLPLQMAKREYITGTIRSVFRKYGFQPLETPALENLSVLSGKYGEDEHLIFKIMRRGLNPENPLPALPDLTEEGLRYDLTVPLARVIAMYPNEITFPFKRYQMQPVWRADRPQKGRYREFLQCDADIAGSSSLLCEAELLAIIRECMDAFGLSDHTIHLNSRKVLTGFAEVIGEKNNEMTICAALDKLEKSGWEEVQKELLSKGIKEASAQKLKSALEAPPSNPEKISYLEKLFSSSPAGKTGAEEIEKTLHYFQALTGKTDKIKIDFTLARGLAYYTGMIFETKLNNVKIGSVSGGGRYDHLIGMFLNNPVTAVGSSFGIDRLCDAMEELDLFHVSPSSSKVLIVNFDAESEPHALSILKLLHEKNISAELYPEPAKLKKQLSYADTKKIPFVLLVGSDEIKSGRYTLKNMTSGGQESLGKEELLQHLG